MADYKTVLTQEVSGPALLTFVDRTPLAAYSYGADQTNVVADRGLYLAKGAKLKFPNGTVLVSYEVV